MESYQKLILWITFASSVAFTLIAALILIKAVKGDKKKNEGFTSGLILFSVGTILATAFFCLAEGLAAMYSGANDAVNGALENAFDSLLYALKTFNVDSDYRPGSALAAALFPENDNFARGLGIYSYALSIVTPVAGFAIFLEVIKGIFPDIGLGIWSFNRKKVYFSELNVRSLALAQSLIEGGAEELGRKKKHFFGFGRVLAVFTDAYVDDKDEQSAELYFKARSMGAICVKKDITELKSLSRGGKKYIFLMDDVEIENIKALAELSNEKHCKMLKNANVYIFYQNDSFVLTEKKTLDNLEKSYRVKYKGFINRNFDSQCRQYAYKTLTEAVQKQTKQVSAEQMLEKLTDAENDEKRVQKAKQIQSDIENRCLDLILPEVNRVRYFENLIYNLLIDIPLYRPLINRPAEKEPSEFNITVLGGGSIGVQMVKSCSWCAQFFGQRPAINVLCLEEKEEFLGRLQSQAPEIVKSTKRNDECLKKYSDKNEYSEPYFTLRYVKADIEKADLGGTRFADVNNENNCHNLLDSDYYLVALGSDELNISVAEQLWRRISAAQASGERARKDVVIVLAVFDPALRAMRNAESTEGCVSIVDYGSLNDAYSWESISMSRTKVPEGSDETMFMSMNLRESTENTRNRRRQIYESRSRLARRVHLKYRMYSAFRYMQSRGFWKENTEYASHVPSLCSGLHTVDGKTLNRLVSDYCNAVYVSVSEKRGEEKRKSGKDCPNFEERLDLENYLGWLEHRRWNAYMRSEGFTYARVKKDIELKLHPCLVERREEKIGTADRLDEIDNEFYKGSEHIKDYDLPRHADKKLIEVTVLKHQKLSPSEEECKKLSRLLKEHLCATADNSHSISAP